jgi:hypothetical protein
MDMQNNMAPQSSGTVILEVKANKFSQALFPADKWNVDSAQFKIKYDAEAPTFTITAKSGSGNDPDDEFSYTDITSGDYTSDSSLFVTFTANKPLEHSYNFDAVTCPEASLILEKDSPTPCYKDLVQLSGFQDTNSGVPGFVDLSFEPDSLTPSDFEWSNWEIIWERDASNDDDFYYGDVVSGVTEYKVTVVNGRYWIDGVQQPSFEFVAGNTYIFDVSSVTSVHAFYITDNWAGGASGANVSTHPEGVIQNS